MLFCLFIIIKIYYYMFTYIYRHYNGGLSQEPVMSQHTAYVHINRAWWLSGKFGALCPKGHRFESQSSRHVGTLDTT